MKPTALPVNTVNTPFFLLKQALVLAAIAVAAFHLAYSFASLSFLVAVFLFCLFALTHLRTPRQAFYMGLGIGLAIYAPQLRFFWTIFGPAAIGLWVILAIFPGMFLALGRACLVRFGPIMLACMAPFLWTGLEYFRSELYFLRFSWLTPGYAFSNTDELPILANYGVYGISFLLMAMASSFYLMPRMSRRTRIVTVILMGCVLAFPLLKSPRLGASARKIHVAGVQLEFPGDAQVRMALDELVKKYPEAELLVLSEYTFQGPVPQLITDWCQNHKKYLVAGGKDFESSTNYFNTAFVIDPNGQIAFKQAKSVPIQFFKDGMPAREQALWDSPWGKLGFAICYDASYTRIIDGLVRQGAQGLIFPTMDVADWGEAQHNLHSRIVPMRAAEYQLPIFRLCSSGISQLVDQKGTVKATAPFPGEQAMIEGVMELPDRGRIPLDRWVGPGAVMIVAALVSWLAAGRYLARRRVER